MESFIAAPHSCVLRHNQSLHQPYLSTASPVCRPTQPFILNSSKAPNARPSSRPCCRLSMRRTRFTRKHDTHHGGEHDLDMVGISSDVGLRSPIIAKMSRITRRRRGLARRRQRSGPHKFSGRAAGTACRDSSRCLRPEGSSTSSLFPPAGVRSPPRRAGSVSRLCAD